MQSETTIRHEWTGDSEIEAIDFILQILNHSTFEFDPVAKSRILQYCTNRITGEMFAVQTATALGQLAGPMPSDYKD